VNGDENKSGAGWGFIVLFRLGIGAIALKHQNTSPSAPDGDSISETAERERYPDSMLEDPNENARRWREQNGQSLQATEDALTLAEIKAAMDKSYLEYKQAARAGDQALAAKKYEEYSFWWNRLNAARR
jgi:hypothetical protein